MRAATLPMNTGSLGWSALRASVCAHGNLGVMDRALGSEDVDQDEKKSALQERKLFTDVSVQQVDDAPTIAYPLNKGPAWEVLLNGKTLKTPAGRALRMPTALSASLVACDFSLVRGKMQLWTMGFCGLAFTAADRVDDDVRIKYCDALVEYLRNDTLRFNVWHAHDCASEGSDIGPVDIAAHAKRVDTLLEDFGNRFLGGLTLSMTTSIAVDTPQAAQDAVRELGMKANPVDLVALEEMASNLRSCVLAVLCLTEGISAEEATALSRFEERLQAATWGHVEGAHDLDQLHTSIAVGTAVSFAHSCR